MSLTKITSTLVLAAAVCAAATPADAGTNATINEFRISSGVDDDNDNFFELAGPAGESLDGLSFVVVSDEFNPGLVNNVFSLDGLSIPSDGFFLAGNAGLFGSTGDSGVDLDISGTDFFGSPSSYLLVSDFTAFVADDLDADDDGVFDASVFTSVIDSVSLVDGDMNTDFSQSSTVIGPAPGDFTPSHVFRFPNGTGAYFQGVFGDTSADTPGTANIPEPTSVVLVLASLACCGVTHRR